MTTTEPTAMPAEPAPLEVVQRARDALITALAGTAMPDAAHLAALSSLDAECRARAGGTEPDALSRLLFLTRVRQSRVERLIAQARRHVS